MASFYWKTFGSTSLGTCSILENSFWTRVLKKLPNIYFEAKKTDLWLSPSFKIIKSSVIPTEFNILKNKQPQSKDVTKKNSLLCVKTVDENPGIAVLCA